MKLWSVLAILTLASCAKITAQSATQSQMEKSDSKKDAEKWTEREMRIMEMAEEEIERTSQEAVKAALLEVGGELAYWKERSELFETENEKLKLEVKHFQKAQGKIKRLWFCNGIAIGVGVAGIATGILVFCFR